MDFRKLKAWQYAHQLAVECKALAATFPLEERFGLANQLRRAADSVALNIAEGAGRSTLLDARRIFVIACTSLDEVEAALALGRGCLTETPSPSLSRSPFPRT